jgi:hypothetical protein
MNISVDIDRIKVGAFMHIDLAPPAHFNVSYNDGIFTVDNNKYGISVSSENLQKIIDGIVEQLKLVMVEK